MNIDELTLGQVKQLKGMLTSDCSERDFEVGEKVLIRTVTHYHTGQVVKESKMFVWLKDAAWIADTGRFSDALTKHELGEVEPMPGLIRVAKGAMVDVSPWTGELPTEQK